MTDSEIECLSNLMFALGWHCRKGVGPGDEFLADAAEILKGRGPADEIKLLGAPEFSGLFREIANLMINNGAIDQFGNLTDKGRWHLQRVWKGRSQLGY